MEILHLKARKFGTKVASRQNSVNYHPRINHCVKLQGGWNTKPCVRLHTLYKITLKALSFMYPVENFTLDSKLLRNQRLWWLWQIWGVCLLPLCMNYKISRHQFPNNFGCWKFSSNKGSLGFLLWILVNIIMLSSGSPHVGTAAFPNIFGLRLETIRQNAVTIWKCQVFELWLAVAKYQLPTAVGSRMPSYLLISLLV